MANTLQAWMSAPHNTAGRRSPTKVRGYGVTYPDGLSLRSARTVVRSMTRQRQCLALRGSSDGVRPACHSTRHFCWFVYLHRTNRPSTEERMSAAAVNSADK